MSQYVDFFVRSRNDDLTLLDSISRSHLIYEIAGHIGAPYEKIKQLTVAKAQEAVEIAESYQQSHQEHYNSLLERQKLVAQFNNSIQDKIELINEISEYLDELKEEIQIANHAKNFFIMLRNFIDTMSYDDDNVGIYFGIEVGRHPSIDDII